MNRGNSKNLSVVLLAFSIMIFCGLLLFINTRVLWPNNHIVNITPAETDYNSEVYLNLGQGFLKKTTMFDQGKYNFQKEVKSFRLELSKPPLLKAENFALKEWHVENNQVVSVWVAYLPSINYDSTQTQKFLITIIDQSADYKIYTGALKWPSIINNGYLTASKPDESILQPHTLMIVKTNPRPEFLQDIRTMKPGIDAVFSIKNQSEEIALEAIALTRYLAMIGQSFELITWSAEELLENFSITTLGYDYWFEGNNLYFDSTSPHITLEYKGSMLQANEIIEREIIRYRLLLNLLALLFSVLIYLLLRLAFMKEKLKDSFKLLYGKTSKLFNITLNNCIIDNVTYNHIAISIFLFLLLINVAVSFFNTTGLSKNLLFLTVFCGIIVFLFNKNKFLLTEGATVQKQPVNDKGTEIYCKQSGITNRSPLFTSIKAWFSQEGWYYLLSLLILVAVGTILRFLNLGQPALFQDEIIQYQALMGLREHGELAIYNPFTGELMRVYTRNAFLTYALSILVNYFGESNFILRLPSAVFGVLLIPVFYFITKNIIGKKFALLGAAFITFNPFMIYYSRFFRNYSILTLFYFLTVITMAHIILELYQNKPGVKKIARLILLGLVSFFLTYHFGAVQSFTLLPLFALGLFFILIYKIMHKEISAMAIMIIEILLAIPSLLVIVELFTEFKLLGIHYALTNHIALDFSSLFQSNHALIYLETMFSFNYLPLTIALIAIAFFEALYNKRIIYSYIIIASFVAYYMIAFLGDRYQDFRYIAFLIPLAALSLLIGLKFLSTLFQQLGSKKSFVRNNLVILFSITFITLPIPFDVNPDSLAGHYLAKGQPWWETDEADLYIHRRAVHPDYEKAFTYINNNSDRDDVFLFHLGSYIYLDKLPEQKVFSIGRDTEYVQPLSFAGEEPVLFNDFLNDFSQHNIWFIGTNIHLVDEKVTEYLLNPAEFENIGTKLDVLKFDYFPWYTDKDATWPTILRRSKRCDY